MNMHMIKLYLNLIGKLFYFIIKYILYFYFNKNVH